MRRQLAAAMLVAWAGAAAATAQAGLTVQDLEEAIGIGQSRLDSVRTRFHAPYRTPVAQPPLDSIEIVTPFRRVVLEAEQHARAGRRFTHRQAWEALEGRMTRVDVHLELTFHPQHTFVNVPEYHVVLISPEGTRRDLDILERTPRSGPRVDGAPLPASAGSWVPGPGLPFSGGRIVAAFEQEAIGPGRYAVVLLDRDEELARAWVDPGVLR